MAVYEYIKIAAQNLMRASEHLKVEASQLRSSTAREVADHERHIHLIQQEQASLTAEQTATDDERRQQEVQNRLTIISREDDDRKKAIADLRRTNEEMIQAKERAAADLQQRSQEIDWMANQPEMKQ